MATKLALVNFVFILDCEGKCLKCDSSRCIVCRSGFKLLNGNCFNPCPPGKVVDVNEQ